MKMRKIQYYLLLAIFCYACNSPRTKEAVVQPRMAAPAPAVEPKVETKFDSTPAVNTFYRAIHSKDSIRKFGKVFTPSQQAIILALNRVDADHVVKLEALIVPNEHHGDVMTYTPYPLSLPFLQDVRKIIFFSYPAQYFGAYENGRLVRSGPTNMGSEKYPTPTGLFYTNWKAEKTRSTFDDEWELRWNFNIQNKEGIGWHQYALPGYPASHSCLRLLEDDAKFLYNWAEEWIAKGENHILAQGTPVIVFGSYPFGQKKPWLQLPADSHALNISVAILQQQTTPYLADIKAQQEKRIRTSTRSK